MSLISPFQAYPARVQAALRSGVRFGHEITPAPPRFRPFNASHRSNGGDHYQLTNISALIHRHNPAITAPKINTFNEI